jgi:transposase
VKGDRPVPDGTYGSDQLAYDFEAALDAATATRASNLRHRAESHLAQLRTRNLAGDCVRWRDVVTYGLGRPGLVTPVGEMHALGCACLSMKPTADRLETHRLRYGDDGVDEVAAAHGIELERAKPVRNWRRIAEVQRLHVEERLSDEEIVFRTGLHIETVRKYRSTPSQKGLTKPSKTPPSDRKAAKATDDLPPTWGTTKKRNLGLRIVALYRSGMTSRIAIADRLRKSDAVVRRYLREAEAAGLLARSA